MSSRSRGMESFSATLCFVLFSLCSHGATEDSNTAFLEVWPDSRTYFTGEEVVLRCSVNHDNSTEWKLKRLQKAEMSSGCSQLNGSQSTHKPEACVLKDIDSSNNGLYWCENSRGNRTRNTINITVSYREVILSKVHPELKENSTVDFEHEVSTPGLVWVSGVCVVLILLVLVPVLWLLVPRLREKLPVCISGLSRTKQEMPKTKQDVTEIQWDLPWMEMDNLLGKQRTNQS